MLSYTKMNKEGACVMTCIVSKIFGKTFDLKREFEVGVWCHKKRTPSNNDHCTPVFYPCSIGTKLAYDITPTDE